MARPRTPTNVLALKGAFKKDPQRLKARKNEPVNKNPLGKPPTWLTTIEKKAWRMIVKGCIEGVLGEADGIAVALASQLLALAMKGEINSQQHNILKSYLAQFGMTPADRSKLNIPAPKKKNIFDVEPIKIGDGKLIPGTRILAPID